ncbi:MAG: hypothetical protein KAI66_03030 [Lentisphaeria bacterium]|nr:hypothetical protein [Lentisphaeria bacterium]
MLAAINAPPAGDEAQPALAWALDLTANDIEVLNRGGGVSFWQWIADRVLTFRPVAVATDKPGWNHLVLVIGVDIVDNKNVYRVADPWYRSVDVYPSTPFDVKLHDTNITRAMTVKDGKWSDAFREPFREENTIEDDPDSDGVMTFDETQASRFKNVAGELLDPNDDDSDNDGKDDKEEIDTAF